MGGGGGQSIARYNNQTAKRHICVWRERERESRGREREKIRPRVKEAIRSGYLTINGASPNGRNPTIRIGAAQVYRKEVGREKRVTWREERKYEWESTAIESLFLLLFTHFFFFCHNAFGRQHVGHARAQHAISVPSSRVLWTRRPGLSPAVTTFSPSNNNQVFIYATENRERSANPPQATKLCPGNLLLVFPVCWWRLINRTRNNYKSKRSIMDSLFVEWTGRTRRWYTLACVGVKQAEAGLNGCWNVVAWNVYTVNTCINKYGSTRVAKCGPRNAYSYQHTLFAWLHHNRRILPESSHKPLLLRGPNARWSGRPIPTRSTTNETNSTLLLCTAHNVSNGISRASISQFSFILFYFIFWFTYLSF